jgi:hypothetical protein
VVETITFPVFGSIDTVLTAPLLEEDPDLTKPKSEVLSFIIPAKVELPKYRWVPSESSAPDLVKVAVCLAVEEGSIGKPIPRFRLTEATTLPSVKENLSIFPNSPLPDNKYAKVPLESTSTLSRLGIEAVATSVI